MASESNEDHDEVAVEVKLKTFKWTKPCFGFFLQGSVKETAIINSFLAIAAMIVLSVAIADYTKDYEGISRLKALKWTQKIVLSCLWTCYYFYWILEICFAKCLYLAAIKREPKRCWTWLQVQGISFAIWFSLFIFHVYYLPWENDILFTCYCLLCFYKLYTFWVIKCFANQLLIMGTFNQILSKLNDEDLENFEKGQNDPKNGPYAREFEIPLEDLNDRSMWVEIGSGQFGTVYKAILKRTEYCQNVAVKTVNSRADILYFKALLSELKIMTVIGPHPNIVNLIGAFTGDIRERKLDLIVELCTYGNLESFLQTRRGLFVNQVDNNGHYIQQACQPKQNVSDMVTLIDLINWSLQTAKGIDYLHSRRVIHGDIAARNVLLTLDKVAKISDFGLSRRLITYKKNYVKELTPRLLPWRHMPPDCLNTHTLNTRFSRESDLWSYGVTLFEYFSLGETPYAHVLEYNKDFVGQILKGNLTLERPSYCPLEIYEIIQGCLKIQLKRRSKFTQIIPLLESLLNQFNSSELDQNSDPLTITSADLEMTLMLSDSQHLFLSQISDDLDDLSLSISSSNSASAHMTIPVEETVIVNEPRSIQNQPYRTIL